MAKGLRSKTKRKARSLIRENLSGPIAIKRQIKISNDIKSSLSEKNGSTIVGLKSILSNNNTKSEHENSNDGSSVGSVESDPKPIGAINSVIVSKKHKYTIKKKSGKQARNNPGKELVWFK
jgi:hypothetical protein